MKEYTADTGAALPEVDPACYAPDAQPLALTLDNEFANIPLTQLVASLTNPRTTFNSAKLQELADSIRVGGVHQPVLVRRLPGARVADTDRQVQYEIVAGERRFRACQLAGVATIPAMVRAMTDREVLEVQIIENLQRDDLSELEEAEGYERLMQHSTLTADVVGAKIGKSRSYVYSRLKLLDLCQEARASLRDGTIDASRALLLSRIPDQGLQIKALQEITGTSYYNSEPMSFRQSQAHIQRSYMLKLSSAEFDIADHTLVPKAGSCKMCPKRTGHAPELFVDVPSADVCTDPTCFGQKNEAHLDKLVNAAREKGQTIIVGKEAQELMAQGYGDKLKGYRRLDMAEDSPTDEPLRKIIGKQMQAEGIQPVMIENPRKKGELVAALTNEMALRLLKTVEGQANAAKTVAKEVRQFASEKKEKAEKKAKAQFEQDWRSQLVERTWKSLRNFTDLGASAFTIDAHRYIALKTAKSLSTEQSDAMCRLLDLGKIAPQSALIDHIKASPDPDRLQLLMMMLRDSDATDYCFHEHVANEGLHLVAGVVFKDALPGVIEEIKKSSLEKYLPDVKPKQPAPTTPLAQPPVLPNADAHPAAGEGAKRKTLVLKKPRLSAQEAQSGIAAAMQGIEAGQVPCPDAPAAKGAPAQGKGQQVKSPAPVQGALPVGIAIGQQVRVLTNVRPVQEKFVNLQGQVIQKVGDGACVVKLKGSKGKPGGQVCFDVTELEIVL